MARVGKELAEPTGQLPAGSLDDGYCAGGTVELCRACRGDRHHVNKEPLCFSGSRDNLDITGEFSKAMSACLPVNRREARTPIGAASH